MEEAWRLCDRLAIVNEGKIIAEGTPQELVARYGGSQIFEARPNPESRGFLLNKLAEHGFEWQGIEDTLYIFQGDGQLLEENLKQQLGIVNQHVPGLEDVFLILTGRSLLE